MRESITTLKGLRPDGKHYSTRPQPRRGWILFAPLTQGSSFLATLGCLAQSLWDCRKAVFIAAVLLCALGLWAAAPLEFDFKDPKGVNNVVFKTDAPLESINGTATGISGKVSFDPQNPGAVKGRIVVAASSLHVGNPMQKEHLHGANWMDVKQYPDMSFEVVESKNVKTDGDVTTADVTGKMTVKSTTKEITVPVKMTYLKDKLAQRVPNQKGDLLVLRSNFTIKRSDFGIGGPNMEQKVSNDIELSLSLAGASPR